MVPVSRLRTPGSGGEALSVTSQMPGTGQTDTWPGSRSWGMRPRCRPWRRGSGDRRRPSLGTPGVQGVRKRRPALGRHVAGHGVLSAWWAEVTAPLVRKWRIALSPPPGPALTAAVVFCLKLFGRNWRQSVPKVRSSSHRVTPLLPPPRKWSTGMLGSSRTPRPSVFSGVGLSRA